LTRECCCCSGDVTVVAGEVESTSSHAHERADLSTSRTDADVAVVLDNFITLTSISGSVAVISITPRYSNGNIRKEIDLNLDLDMDMDMDMAMDVVFKHSSYLKVAGDFHVTRAWDEWSASVFTPTIITIMGNL